MDKLTSEDLKSYISTSSGLYPSQLDSEEMHKAGLESFVMVIPSDFKERIRYFGNMLAQQCYNTKTEDPFLKVELLTLATTLSYLLNSTSYENGVYHRFDKDEISRKLRREQ